MDTQIVDLFLLSRAWVILKISLFFSKNNLIVVF